MLFPAMTDFKLFLPKFDGHKSSDFGLWLCRLEAVLEDKGIVYTIEPEDSLLAPPSQALSSPPPLPLPSLQNSPQPARRPPPSSLTAWALSPFESLFLIAEILR
jgi:hypothetical protein